MRQPIKLLPILFFPLLLVHQPASAQDGEKIFKQNCGACHMIGRRLVGPDLTGITDKRSRNGSTPSSSPRRRWSNPAIRTQWPFSRNTMRS
ncbi:MAG: c-type cytochrome [Flavobacteriales bacterium]|nr:c-type cytochrome [Flavobacteriales bacterium]